MATLKRYNGSSWDEVIFDRYVRYDTNSQGLTDTQKSNARTNIGAGTSSLSLGSTSSTASAGNHLYHYWTSNAYYSDSYSGEKNWRMMTENVLADTLRFKAGSIANKEYYDYTNSTWTTWDKDLSSLFDGMAGTNTTIPYAQRKFRFTITSSSGWPTTTMLCLEGSWYDAGTISKVGSTNAYVVVTIETRASANDSWATKVTANFPNNCMNKNALCVPSSALHTGHTLYRITVELGSWTNTSNSASLRRLMVLSNYGGNALSPFTYSGSGKVTAMNTLNATTLQEGGTNLSSKYLLLAGGTMSSGAVIDMNGGTIKFTGLASSVSSSPKLEAYVGTTRKGFFGWNENGAAIFNAAGREYTITSSAFYKQGSGNVNLGATSTNCQWHNLYMDGVVDLLNSSYHGQLTPATLTAARTWTLPNQTGTLALTSDIPSVPTKTSDLTNDSGYITSSSLSSYVPTTRTVNGKALSSDITLSASDVQALPNTTSYVKSASVSGNTLTLTTTGLPVTYTPSISTAYLSDTPTSRSDSDTTTNYLIGKSSTSATGTNYYNSKVYFKGNKLYSNGTEVSVVGHTHSNYLTSHLYRPIQMNGTQILANSSSSALNLVAGTGITLSNSSGSVTISSSGGSVSGYKYETFSVNGNARYFTYDGSGKVIITSIENDIDSGWFFRILNSGSVVIEYVLYLEIVIVDYMPVVLNFVDTSGTWGSFSYDADWGAFSNWRIDSPMGWGDVCVNYIGDFL